MRLFFAVFLTVFVAAPAFAGETKACIQVCPELCVTKEEAATNFYRCTQFSEKDLCAQNYGTCKLVKGVCKWKSTKAYKACLAEING